MNLLNKIINITMRNQYNIGRQQQLVGESNPDKEKVIQEFQNRLHGPLNNKNMGLYVKAFMRYV